MKVQVVKTCVVASLLALAIAVAKFPAEAAAAATDAKLDLGGFRVHVSVTGQGVPVVFEAGLGEDLATWRNVQEAVARFATTVLYDRPGLGASEPSPHPRTNEVMVGELHALLGAAHIRPPYVLVGHSAGGALVQVYAHRYPHEVAGLVLVDPEDGRLLDRLKARLPPDQWAARERALEAEMPGMPPAVREEQRGFLYGEHAGPGALPDVPVVILTGTRKNPEFPGNPLEQDLKLQLHQELLATLPQGRQVLVPQSRHYIQNDAPDTVIDAVREVLSKKRP